MERERVAAALDLAEGRALDPAADALLKAVSALNQADPDHRPKEALSVIERLRQVQPGQGEGAARAVMSALEDAELRRAETPEGVSCRAEAVAALLRLGYPFALEVRPEDLLFYRQRSGTAQGPSLGLMTVLIVVAIGLGAGAWLWMTREEPPSATPPTEKVPLRR